MSPTISLTAAATQMGMVIGTAAYMAPEQARGKVVDKRADIFAFGVVLYEMLTGQRPFQGEDVSLTLAAVMTFDPDLDRLPEALSPTLKTYLSRCLAKDPKARLRDIGDVRLAMDGAFETERDASLSPTSGLQLGLWPRPLAGLAAVLLVAVVTGSITWTLTQPAPARVLRATITPPPTTALSFNTGTSIALTSDGSRLVYRATAGNEAAFFVRPLGELEASRLTRSASSTLRDPFTSPDGSWVAYFTAADLQKVPIRGGPTTTISQFSGTSRGGSWGADDTIIFATSDPDTGLWRVSAASRSR